MTSGDSVADRFAHLNELTRKHEGAILSVDRFFSPCYSVGDYMQILLVLTWDHKYKYLRSRKSLPEWRRTPENGKTGRHVTSVHYTYRTTLEFKASEQLKKPETSKL